MGELKFYKKEVFTSVIYAILGVGLGIIPYFCVAKLITNLLAGNKIFGDYLNYILIIFVGLIGNLVFHELSTITSHNLAFKIIEKKRKELVRKLNLISMGEVEKRSSGQWAQFVVETLDKLEKPIAHVIPEVIANLFIPIVIEIIILFWIIDLE